MKKSIEICLILSLLGACQLTSAGEAMPAASAVDLVNGFEGAFGGPHPGKRRTHAKGFCISGSFKASLEARKNFDLELTNSKKEIPVIGRFSAAGGDPMASDKTRSPRGMALRFLLPKGSYHQMAMLSTPVFAAATPDSFLGLLQAQKMDPATGKRDQYKIAEYIKIHPDTQAQSQWLKEHNPPASLAQSNYFSVSTFFFRNKKEAKTPVRWFFAPEAGEKQLSEEEMTKNPDQFLETEFAERLKKSSATWTWSVIEGRKGDTLTNPTLAWPMSDHKVINMGKLTIKKLEDIEVCDAFNFDPLVLSNGVEPSEDPILRIRSAAYATSFGRRSQEKSSQSTAN
jgi:catalase